MACNKKTSGGIETKTINVHRRSKYFIFHSDHISIESFVSKLYKKYNQCTRKF